MTSQQSGASPIKVLRFSYKGQDPERHLETIPFYLEKLRSFLRQHIGSAVWLKGGIIEQPAYLVFNAELAQKVVDLLTRELEEGGKFAIAELELKEAITTLKKYVLKERVAIGYFKTEGLELGSLETVAPPEIEPTLEKVREGFMLTEYLFIKADETEQKGEWMILKNVVEMGISEGKKIAYVEIRPQLGIRAEDINRPKITLRRWSYE